MDYCIGRFQEKEFGSHQRQSPPQVERESGDRKVVVRNAIGPPSDAENVHIFMA